MTLVTSNQKPLQASQIVILLVVVLLGIALRLVNIDAPLIGPHSYRQSDTAAIARNFHVDGVDLGRPRIDSRGSESGVLGETEMPLYNATVALVYGVTGPELWVARSVAGLGSIVVLFSLFWLVRRWTGNNNVALISSVVWFLLPYNIYFSTAIMPESWMLAGTTLGLLLFDIWAEKPRRFHFLLLSAVVTAFAGLVKVPALHIGLVMGVVLWWRQPSLRTWVRLLPALILFAAIVLLPTVFWTMHTIAVGKEKGASVMGLSAKLWDFTPLLRWSFYNKVIFQHIAEKLVTWAGMPLVIIGGIFAWKHGGGYRLPFAWCGAVLLLFMVSLGPLEPHEYYKLPLVLPFCVFIGVAIEEGLFCKNDRPRQLVLLGLAIGVAVLAFGRLPRIWSQQVPEQSSEYALGEALSRYSDQGELVVVANPHDNWDVTVLYLANRKGWVVDVSNMDVESGFDEMYGKGVSLLGCRKDQYVEAHEQTLLDELREHHRVVFEDDDVIVFAQRESGDRPAIPEVIDVPESSSD